MLRCPRQILSLGTNEVMPKTKDNAKKRETPGPKPEMLKIKGNWKDAVTKSFQKKKPSEGWPK